MHIPVGIKSLAVSFPSIIRTNEYYKENYPDLVAKSEEKSLARLMSLVNATPSNEFELEMMAYLKDPFRGSVERRVLAPGESSLTLECRAAKDALDATKLSPDEVDLLIVSSLLPEKIAIGNAVFVARELGLKCAAWNLDAACGSTPVALETACALVQAGTYRNILVVISCTNSRIVDDDDTVAWFLGDGAGAFVVAPLEINQGILGSKTINTCALCEQLSYKVKEDELGNPQIRIQIGKQLNRLIGDTAPTMLRTCSEGAVASAGVTLEEIDFFIFHTSTAWLSKFSTGILNVDPECTINLFSQYANMGPVIVLANLYHAAQTGKISENDLVLMYSFGATSSACATVMRWGNVALGPVPVSGMVEIK